MKFPKSFLLIAIVLTILCATANAEETKLQGLIVTKEIAITPLFVDDACLRSVGNEPQRCIKKMEKTSPKAMNVEFNANSGLKAGKNKQCIPGSVRFISIFFMQRWGEYYITITLNKHGQDLFQKALKNIGDKKMALVFGNSVLANPLPMMTETISEILVKFDDVKPALDLLKHISK